MLDLPGALLDPRTEDLGERIQPSDAGQRSWTVPPGFYDNKRDPR